MIFFHFLGVMHQIKKLSELEVQSASTPVKPTATSITPGSASGSSSSLSSGSTDTIERKDSYFSMVTVGATGETEDHTSQM